MFLACFDVQTRFRLDANLLVKYEFLQNIDVQQITRDNLETMVYVKFASKGGEFGLGNGSLPIRNVEQMPLLVKKNLKMAATMTVVRFPVGLYSVESNMSRMRCVQFLLDLKHYKGWFSFEVFIKNQEYRKGYKLI